jgi:AcrR family transcriptional regulator
MPKANAFELAAEEIVAAAVDIFLTQGLDAVSMRSVAARLGVSPAPLYSRVGNKDSLVDAIADHLLAGLSTVDDTQLYVTRGAGFWGPPVRIGAPPDVTVLTLEPWEPVAR